MRILYLDPDFELLTGQTGPRSLAFARRLVARGHQVAILTSARHTAGLLPPGAGRLSRVQTDGVEVEILNVPLRRDRSMARRIWSHLRFMVLVLPYLLRCDRPDVLYVTSPPLSVVLPAVVMRRLRKVPFVLEVRELWPEVPRGTDLIRSRLLVWCLRRIALLGYRQAARVVALTEPAVRHIEADLPLSRKVVYVPACCDVERFGREDGKALRQKHGWEGKFLCVYVGSMSRAAGLEAIVRVADVVREDEQFVFLLVGGGDGRTDLERNIRNRELRNVVLWPAASSEELPGILAAADLCLLTARQYRVLEQSVSDRLFDYLAAGRPVLLNYSGWQRELLESSGAGLGTTLGHHGEFFEHLCQLCDQPELRRRMGASARRLAETKFHPDVLIEPFLAVLTEAAGPR